MNTRIKAFLAMFLPVAAMIIFTVYLAGWFLNTVSAQNAVAFGTIALILYWCSCAYVTRKP